MHPSAYLCINLIPLLTLLTLVRSAYSTGFKKVMILYLEHVECLCGRLVSWNHSRLMKTVRQWRGCLYEYILAAKIGDSAATAIKCVDFYENRWS